MKRLMSDLIRELHRNFSPSKKSQQGFVGMIVAATIAFTAVMGTGLYMMSSTGQSLGKAKQSTEIAQKFNRAKNVLSASSVDYYPMIEDQLYGARTVISPRILKPLENENGAQSGKALVRVAPNSQNVIEGLVVMPFLPYSEEIDPDFALIAEEALGENWQSVYSAHQGLRQDTLDTTAYVLALDSEAKTLSPNEYLNIPVTEVFQKKSRVDVAGFQEFDADTIGISRRIAFNRGTDGPLDTEGTCNEVSPEDDITPTSPLKFLTGADFNQYCFPEVDPHFVAATGNGDRDEIPTTAGPAGTEGKKLVWNSDRKVEYFSPEYDGDRDGVTAGEGDPDDQEGARTEYTGAFEYAEEDDPQFTVEGLSGRSYKAVLDSLPSCADSTDKLLYNNGQFTCGTDLSGAGGASLVLENLGGPTALALADLRGEAGAQILELAKLEPGNGINIRENPDGTGSIEISVDGTVGGGAEGRYLGAYDGAIEDGAPFAYADDGTLFFRRISSADDFLTVRNVGDTHPLRTDIELNIDVDRLLAEGADIPVCDAVSEKSVFVDDADGKRFVCAVDRAGSGGGDITLTNAPGGPGLTTAGGTPSFPVGLVKNPGAGSDFTIKNVLAGDNVEIQSGPDALIINASSPDVLCEGPYADPLAAGSICTGTGRDEGALNFRGLESGDDFVQLSLGSSGSGTNDIIEFSIDTDALVSELGGLSFTDFDPACESGEYLTTTRGADGRVNGFTCREDSGGVDLAGTCTAPNQAVKWNGSALYCGNVDLDGFIEEPVCSDGQVLQYNAARDGFECGTVSAGALPACGPNQILKSFDGVWDCAQDATGGDGTMWTEFAMGSGEVATGVQTIAPINTDLKTGSGWASHDVLGARLSFVGSESAMGPGRGAAGFLRGLEGELQMINSRREEALLGMGAEGIMPNGWLLRDEVPLVRIRDTGVDCSGGVGSGDCDKGDTANFVARNLLAYNSMRIKHGGGVQGGLFIQSFSGIGGETYRTGMRLTTGQADRGLSTGRSFSIHLDDSGVDRGGDHTNSMSIWDANGGRRADLRVGALHYNTLVQDSDERLKKNIRYLEPGATLGILDDLFNKVKVAQYDRCKDCPLGWVNEQAGNLDENEIGFIAQDLIAAGFEEFVEETEVIKADDPDVSETVYSVAYDKIGKLTTMGMMHNQNQIQYLMAENEFLKCQLAEVMARLDGIDGGRASTCEPPSADPGTPPITGIFDRDRSGGGGFGD